MAQLRRILIIGGTGDLSRRHLLPALTRLLANGELPADFAVVVTGLEPMPVEECRALLGGELSVHAAHLPAAAREALVGRISYLQADVRDVDSLQAAGLTEPVLVYVATPPAAVPDALRAISHAGVAPPTRLVLDKPFGLSRASARDLNHCVGQVIEEHCVFRVDHFLYHYAVQELLRWRVQSDPLCLVDLLPVKRAEIIWDETRMAHSDSHLYLGAMRDMVQSHLLQLVALITMDPPESMTRDDLAKNRLAALRRVSSGADVESSIARGRHVGDSLVAASLATRRKPETFVTLELRSGMPRWQNVRFFLRAAKGIAQSRRYIELRFGHRSPGRELGYVRLDVLAGHVVVDLARDEASAIEFWLPADQESASTRLLRAALVGDDTFTLHPEEPEESWRIVEPMLKVWNETDPPMTTYPVGASIAEIVRSRTEPGGA